MTKKEQQAIERQQEIERLSFLVRERAQTKRGGSAVLVPTGSKKGFYRVDLDEQYRTIGCTCQGGHYDCKHKQAVRLYFVKKIRALRNNTLNPIYEFIRAGQLIRARLSQFSKAEKQALREQEQIEAEAAARARYVQEFDPCLLAA